MTSTSVLLSRLDAAEEALRKDASPAKVLAILADLRDRLEELDREFAESLRESEAACQRLDSIQRSSLLRLSQPGVSSIDASRMQVSRDTTAAEGCRVLCALRNFTRH